MKRDWEVSNYLENIEIRTELQTKNVLDLSVFTEILRPLCIGSYV